MALTTASDLHRGTASSSPASPFGGPTKTAGQSKVVKATRDKAALEAHAALRAKATKRTHVGEKVSVEDLDKQIAPQAQQIATSQAIQQKLAAGIDAGREHRPRFLPVEAGGTMLPASAEVSTGAPSWLWLLLGGAAVAGAGILYVTTRKTK